MHTPADHEPERASVDSKAMGFWEHIDELRGTIIKSIVVFLLFAALIGYYLTEFNRVLMTPLHRVAAEYPQAHAGVYTQTMSESFNVIVDLCVYGGLLLAAPIIMFFVAQFVSPALTPREKSAVVPLCVSAFVLFLAGAAFGYFMLLPGALRMKIEIDLAMEWGDGRLTLGSYYSTLTALVLGVGATFEFPLLVVLLVWIGLVKVAFLRRYRRHAIVVIMTLAAIVTPTTDPSQMLLFSGPLYALYELAIVVAARIEKQRERSAAAVVLALLALLPRWRSAAGHDGLRGAVGA